MKVDWAFKIKFRKIHSQKITICANVLFVSVRDLESELEIIRRHFDFSFNFFFIRVVHRETWVFFNENICSIDLVVCAWVWAEPSGIN